MHGRDALFPDFDQLKDAENALTERLSQARHNYASRKATSTELTPDWLGELKSKRFDQADDLEPLMNWVIDALDTGSVQMTHPGYLGLFNPAPTFAAECADRIASSATLALNSGEWFLRFFILDRHFRHAIHLNGWPKFPRPPLIDVVLIAFYGR